jgi:hypothetical protein
MATTRNRAGARRGAARGQCVVTNRPRSTLRMLPQHAAIHRDRRSAHHDDDRRVPRAMGRRRRDHVQGETEEDADQEEGGSEGHGPGAESNHGHPRRLRWRRKGLRARYPILAIRSKGRARARTSPSDAPRSRKLSRFLHPGRSRWKISGRLRGVSPPAKEATHGAKASRVVDLRRERDCKPCRRTSSDGRARASVAARRGAT